MSQELSYFCIVRSRKSKAYISLYAVYILSFKAIILESWSVQILPFPINTSNITLGIDNPELLVKGTLSGPYCFSGRYTVGLGDFLLDLPLFTLVRSVVSCYTSPGPGCLKTG